MKTAAICIKLTKQAAYFASSLFITMLPHNLLADTVFRLDTLNAGNESQSGFVTLIDERLVLTSAGLVDQGNQWVVNDHTTGASLVASLIASDEENDLALLQVNGLQGEPAILASVEAIIGRNISLNIIDQLREGTIHSEIQRRSGPVNIRHTALLQDNEFAAPLLNNCGELLGISQNLRVSVINRRLAVDEEFGFVGDVDVLKSFLQANSVNYLESTTSCLSDAQQLRVSAEEALLQEQELLRLQEEQADLEAEQLALEAERAELEEETARLLREQEAAALRNEELSEEAQQQMEVAVERETELQAALDQLEIERRDLELNTSLQQEALAASEEEQERQQRQQLYISVGSGGILLILLVLVFKQVRRRKQVKEETDQQISSEKVKAAAVQAELSKASAKFPDILLFGNSKENQDIRLKLDGTALIRSSEGQVIGRSAQHASYVLNLEHVSRQHLRFTVKENCVYIEDLDTLNGSAINGIDLTHNQQAILKDSDELRIGLQLFTVRMMDSEKSE